MRRALGLFSPKSSLERRVEFFLAEFEKQSLNDLKAIVTAEGKRLETISPEHGEQLARMIAARRIVALREFKPGAKGDESKLGLKF